MTNPSSSNSNAYFHVYSLDGGNTWSTRVFVTIQPGGTDTTSALVPDGQRMMKLSSTEIEPTDVVMLNYLTAKKLICF